MAEATQAPTRIIYSYEREAEQDKRIAEAKAALDEINKRLAALEARVKHK